MADGEFRRDIGQYSQNGETIVRFRTYGIAVPKPESQPDLEDVTWVEFPEVQPYEYPDGMQETILPIPNRKLGAWGIHLAFDKGPVVMTAAVTYAPKTLADLNPTDFNPLDANPAEGAPWEVIEDYPRAG